MSWEHVVLSRRRIITGICLERRDMNRRLAARQILFKRDENELN